MVANIAIAVTIDDLLSELGGIAACRIRLDPPPGQATLNDLVRVNDQTKIRLVELIDGTLVEKAAGYEASVVGIAIARIIGAYVAAHRLGVVSGADGMFQLRSSVRGPDVAYVARERLPNAAIPGFTANVSDFFNDLDIGLDLV